MIDTGTIVLSERSTMNPYIHRETSPEILVEVMDWSRTSMHDSTVLEELRDERGRILTMTLESARGIRRVLQVDGWMKEPCSLPRLVIFKEYRHGVILERLTFEFMGFIEDGAP